MVRSKTIIATPPGATVKEQLIDRGMTQKEFASRMDMSEKHISKLINGEVRLTSDVAMRLEIVLGIPSSFWMNLESIYRERLVMAQIERETEEDLEIVKMLPYSEMARHGWVPDTRKPIERVINCRKFFEVVRLNLLNESLIPNIAYRRTGFISETGTGNCAATRSDYALIAWAQKAKLSARKIRTAPIDIEALSSRLPSIRAMTLEEPDKFCPELCASMAECGVALVFLPHFGGSFLHGATFRDSNKIVVGLTLRGRDSDKFWFSLFHELGHIMLGHTEHEGGTTPSDERDADIFARDILIPENDFKRFILAGRFDKASVLAFSESISIAPGIVVGRLQKEKYVNYGYLEELKTKYAFEPAGA